MNILYERLPEYVILNGKQKEIITDYREWLRFYDMIKDDSISDHEKTFFISRYYLSELSVQDFPLMLPPLVRFFKQEEGEMSEDNDETQERPYKRLFDYSFDAKCIAADFYSSYKIDLFHEKTKMHWWKFNILLQGLPADTEFKQRVMYRNTDIGQIMDKKERNRIQSIQRKIALPEIKPTDSDIGDMFW